MRFVCRSHTFLKCACGSPDPPDAGSNAKVFIRPRLARPNRGSWAERLVEWLGQLDLEAMRKVPTRSQVFAICSHVENSPNSLSAAMAVGVLCVAGYAGRIPSLLEDERGLLFRNGNVAQLIATTRPLVHRWGLLRTTERGARFIARVRHVTERVVAQTMNAYCTLTGNAVDFRATSEGAQAC